MIEQFRDDIDKLKSQVADLMLRVDILSPRKLDPEDKRKADLRVQVDKLNAEVVAKMQEIEKKPDHVKPAGPIIQPGMIPPVPPVQPVRPVTPPVVPPIIPRPITTPVVDQTVQVNHEVIP